MAKPNYSETIEVHGVTVPVVLPVINDRMRAEIESGRYERGEVRAMQRLARADDVVLELGAGVGVVSTAAARVVGADRVVSVEANPELIPIIGETHRLSGVTGIRLLHGVGMPTPGDLQEIPFYLRENFWASSMDSRREDRKSGNVREAMVPVIDLNALIGDVRPTILAMDIEGGELPLARGLDLSPFRLVIMELHPRVYGHPGVAELFGRFADAGLTYDAKASRGGTVVVFSRYRQAVPTGPSVCAVTCMKDEAPYIFEWIAYHRAIGITDFLVFTNDCSDRTVRILDALDRRGIVRHLPNPSQVLNSPHHQPIAVQYAKAHKEARDADWVISMDIDEFINIHIGDGHLADLFGRLPEAEVISLCHLDFGCAGIETYEDRFIIEQMMLGADKSPPKAVRRGLKTLVHRDAPSNRLSNHRPFFADAENASPVWVDGSGRPMPRQVVAGEHKGMDCRGAYDLVQLNHYPVRSMESYLFKTTKGDVVAKNKFVGAEYFEKRDAREQRETSIARQIPAARAMFEDFMADPELRRLHRGAVRYHRRQISNLKDDPEKLALFEAMRAQYPIVESTE
jgi:FkbM family methyltransferase